jgi:hypothetical protein
LGGEGSTSGDSGFYVSEGFVVEEGFSFFGFRGCENPVKGIINRDLI